MFEESTGVLGLHELTTDAVCVGVSVCVADNEIRAPPPPLRVSILFSPIRPPFISSSLFFSSPVASGIFLSSLTSYFAK